MISGPGATDAAGTPRRAAPSLDELRDLLARLGHQDGAGLTEAELVDHLTAMERLKSALAAAQARVTATFALTRAAHEAAAGVPADQRCRGLATEVVLARRDSPIRGRRHLGLARALVHEMPHTLAALCTGEISEWRATLVVRETAVLSAAHRTRVDAELAGTLAGAGDRQVAAEARKIGYRLDPGSAIRRVRGAHADRHVGLRPAPDTMAYLTGFLPVVQGVACQAALTREADALRAAGDPRTRGQIMADTLVERVTGRQQATGLPVEVSLVMTDQTLLAGGHEPAHLEGYGPIPAALARELTREADRAWVRRLYTSPTTGSLVAMDSRRRLFEGELRRFVILGDQVCRNPWCGAPIRHVDHVRRATDGGPTSADNAQGLCETCNHTKELPGWKARRLPGVRHVVETITPTGHAYRSRAPDPPGIRPRPTAYESPLELRLGALLVAA
jgi:5-methylcytosine-specific restriction endonuclease McrA